MLQARAATKDAADARKHGYLKAAIDGAMSQASKVLSSASSLICWQGLRPIPCACSSTRIGKPDQTETLFYLEVGFESAWPDLAWSLALCRLEAAVRDVIVMPSCQSQMWI